MFLCLFSKGDIVYVRACVEKKNETLSMIAIKFVYLRLEVTKRV